MYNYSFIIPHKNCPDLLQRCVDSIPMRDDVQVIVVDDNSDADKKPLLKGHSNLRVILLDAIQSKGAGRARNVGIEHAQGNWLLFADADDYYTNYLQTFLDKYADDETTDIVYLNACKFNEKGVITPHKTDKLITNYIKGVNGAEMDLRYSLWTPWSRMVKRAVVEKHNIMYDELPAGNDLMFGLRSSRYAKKVQVEKNIIYMYFKQSKGSYTDAAREKMFDSRLALRGKMISFYREVGYNSNSSLFDVIFHSLRLNHYSFKVTLNKYREYLGLYNISIFSDILRFVLRRFI